MFHRQKGIGSGAVIATIIIIIISLALLYIFLSNSSDPTETVEGTVSSQELQASPESQAEAEVEAQSTADDTQENAEADTQLTAENLASPEAQASTEAQIEPGDEGQVEAEPDVQATGTESQAEPESQAKPESQADQTDLQASAEQGSVEQGSVEQAQDTRAAKSYTVSGGDTLASIARENNTTVTALAEENALANPHQLSIGQVITIPQAPDQTNNTQRTYTVKAKDTLYSIAKRYATSVEALRDANGIDDIAVIKAGQVLTLPPDALSIPK